MKRFITYLYNYEGGAKGKGAGFARIDLRGREVRMEVNVREANNFQGKGKIYLIANKDGVVGIPVGEITILGGNGNMDLRFSYFNMLGNDIDFSYVIGMAVRYDSGYLASSWQDKSCPELVSGSFRVISSGRVEENVQMEAFGSVAETYESASNIKEVESNQVVEVSKLTEETVSETISPTKKAVEDIIKPVEEMKGLTNSNFVKEELPHEIHLPVKEKAAQEIISTEQERVEIPITTSSKRQTSLHMKPRRAEEPTYRKIQLSHIHDLPATNRHLCNNSFLLHGFFNYNYLVLKKERTEDGEKWSLGVPGVYEQPEKMMAIMFGFPEFEAQDKESRDEHPQDIQAGIQGTREPKEGTFGAWFVVLKK